MTELEETLNNGMEDVKLDTCDAVPEVKKHFLGVRQIKNKWCARVRHPKLKFEIYLGTYSSAEEAALAVKKKKAEYAEIFKIGDSVNVETSGDAFGERKLPYGVCRRGYGRWGAQIWHPGLKKEVSLGSFNSPEEAAAAMDYKKAEFLEMYGPRSKHIVMSKSKHEVPKMPAGVRKLKSGRFGARFRDPKSRARISLGTFDTFEEADRSIQKKKAMVDAERKRAELNGSETNKGLMKGECELGPGCLTSVVNSNEASLIGQGIQQNTSNAYNFDEAERNMAEFLEMYSSRNKHKVLNEPKHEVPKVTAGVRKLKSGRFGARFRDPKSRARISLGTFDTFEEAVRSIQKKKAMVDAERKGAKLNGSEANDEGECEFGHGFLTSEVNSNEAGLIGQESQQITSNAGDFDEVERKRAELNIYEANEGTMKRESEFGRGCLSSVVNSNEAGLIGEGDQQRTSDAYDFDEAVNSGFINEYGELLGMYSEVDRRMGFSLNGEPITSIGYYQPSFVTNSTILDSRYFLKNLCRYR